MRDRQMVVPERALPPTPSNQDTAPYDPVRRSYDSMHPALRRALEEQDRLRAQRKPVAASPGDAWLTVRRSDQDNRAAPPVKPVHQIEQSCDRTSKIHKDKWRPKHSSCWESQSLPSSDVSTKFDSNDANPSFGSDQSNGGAPFRDIRGSIADELDIVLKGDGTGWVNKHAWKDYHSLPGSDDDGSNGSFKKRWLPQYCSDWVASLSDIPPPRVSLQGEDAATHWESDINPMDGRIMSPVDYPQSTVNPQDPNTREELVRRMSGTAEIRVTMEGEKLRKRMKHREQKEEKRAIRYLGPRYKRVSDSPAPTDPPNTLRRSSRGYEQAPGQTDIESRRADHREPRILCYLRPVERSDLPQILEVYNWEVEHGRQALDARPLVLQDIQRLFEECDASGTPFIVAVRGTPSLGSIYRGGETSLVPFRGPPQQPGQSSPYEDEQATPANLSSSDKILGFGLITLPSAGLAGNSHTSVGRFNGKVHFYVEPRSRRLGVGRCILHRLLRCCSRHLLKADWYKWFDPYDSKACAEPGYNMRNYARVFAEVASFKGDPDFGWRKKLLEEMKFLYVNTTDLTRKVVHDANGGWFDNTVWQHDCGGPGDVYESN